MALVGLCRGVRLGGRPTDMSYSSLSHLTIFFKLTNTFSAYCFKEHMMQRKKWINNYHIDFQKAILQNAEPNFGMKNRKSPVSAKGDLCFEPIQGMKRKDRKGSQAKTLISSGRAKTSSLIPCLLWTWEKGSQGRKDLTINIYADKYTDVALSPYPPVLCALHNKNSRMISILL